MYLLCIFEIKYMLDLTILGYPAINMIFLGIFAFLAGFIDAVVGGGGLLQLPALLITMPNQSVSTVFGTNKISAFLGTSSAAIQYARKIKFNYPLLLNVATFAFVASHFGAKAVSLIKPEVIKPILLIILILIAIFIIKKKNIGLTQTKQVSPPKQFLFGALIGLTVGFYDGFFGPGTGSFLMLGFVTLLGFEFLAATAHAKIINCLTNISALIVFISQGNFIMSIGLFMASMNITGNILGSKMALKKGNTFVRKIFLVSMTLLILRYGWDVVEIMF